MTDTDEDAELTIRPLLNLADVWKWEAQSANYLVVPQVELKPRKIATSIKRSRTLVCHDMKGGYLNDRFVQGTSGSTGYRFVHWAKIDLFVYFSHSFVTIPPPSWTDAAHLHGVPILGTLITENADGMELCKELFNGRDPYYIINFIHKMVAIAKFYKFDGWLINIENPIEPDHVQHVRNFLDWLTTKMHEAIPNSFVIWYDSVLEDGMLRWQNELNAKNRIFFDACDGIYLNYNWNRELLDASAAVASSERATDVYVGVDVFGRGTLGGGGFNCQEAIKVVLDVGLSTALFAQGWVYEVLGEENFVENDQKFWNLLADLTPTHGPSFLPFATSFCQGFGNQLFRYGELIQSAPWSNQSLQQYQAINYGDDNSSNIRVCTDISYNGGGSLEVTGTLRRRDKHNIGLFASWFDVRFDVLCTFSYLVTSPTAVLVDLVLDLHDINGLERVWMLTASEDVDVESRPVKVIRPAGSEVLLELEQLGIRVPSVPQNGWVTKCHILSPEEVDAWVSKVSIQVSQPTHLSESAYRILLGQVQFCPLQSLLERPELVVSCSHVATLRTTTALQVSGVVSWSGGPPDQLLDCYDLHCRVFWHDPASGEPRTVTRFINSTRRRIYKVGSLAIAPSPPGDANVAFSLRFIVCEQLIGFGGCDVEHGAYAEFKFD